MTGSLPPAGWYPDPSNDQQLRWWTGERWTGAARPLESRDTGGQRQPGGVAAATPAASTGGARPVDPTSELSREPMAFSAQAASREEAGTTGSSTGREDPGTTWLGGSHEDGGADEAGWPRERLIAAVAIGGLLLLSLAIWLFAVVLTGSGGDDPSAGGTVTVDDDEATVGDDEATAGEGTDTDGGSTQGGDDGGTDGDEAASGATAERTVDFDGACTVVLDDDGDADGQPLRPWQFEECAGAPVSLDGDGRWIVVIASMDGDLEESQARARARDHDPGYGLLWSTHYPSLNPGWWVVFDGPFAEEDAAVEVAEEIGGGAYPRLLSDDEHDRYCIADDGC